MVQEVEGRNRKISAGKGLDVRDKGLCKCMYVKSRDYGDVSVGAQQGRLTMS